ALPRPGAAHGEARAGEGLAAHQLLGEAELAPDAARLVLEERLQRLDEPEAQLLGKAAHVVVGLDLRRRAAGGGARLDDVRVERALRQELHLLEGARGG